jgi:hypothetical protein
MAVAHPVLRGIQQLPQGRRHCRLVISALLVITQFLTLATETVAVMRDVAFATVTLRVAVKVLAAVIHPLAHVMLATVALTMP